ncbi:response regulator [Sphingomonas sp. R86521]|uniref:response regulator n=1 Tax=Sphingomonas sp. R86521 TaxID=3093860 RepID=UPI0036D42900
MTTPIRIAVVDDHPFLRDGVRAVLDTQADMVVVAEAERGEQVLEMFERHNPDIILMDLQMPGMGGVAAIEALRAVHPGARIIVLTTYAGDTRALRALRSGAAGYLLKSSMRRELLLAIRSVHAGKHTTVKLETDLRGQTDEAITTRELEILKLAADGNSNKMIAIRLGLTESTIKGYMKTILAKLGVADRTHAVMIAAKRGIINL